MLVVVAYDVNVETKEGRRRLRRVAKICVDYGQRVQNSLFEILVDNAQWVALKARLQKEIDPEKDSLRYYFLGNSWHAKIEEFGAKTSYDPEGLLIV